MATFVPLLNANFVHSLDSPDKLAKKAELTTRLKLHWEWAEQIMEPQWSRAEAQAGEVMPIKPGVKSLRQKDFPGQCAA